MPNNMAQMIDHTLLKPEVTKEQILALCEEAKGHQFASVCVNPAWIEDAAALLKGTDVKVCTVIGFPLGASTPDVKAFETKDAIDKGAQEVDMVINIGALKSGNLALVENDIRAVTAAAKGKALVKVIIETCLLSDEEKKVACKIAKKAGADFVKTSTGFSNGGATERDVKLMREAVGSQMGVKASGGVRSHEDAVKMINAGATRIGTSSGPKIVNMQ
ncbi:deoxyribose-phosphate aldolase [Siminovitchia fortis]|uniref:Deoxyribose-phosphate aldolase n=1 Tax=Siminovitchia fortis TaxID=254758 RepID=A0A443J4P6_9BACI|nr:deoxyribose-phosphate aldolase [Siminovitchia fortis]RWR15293.1 deoxyribose-phosphate aldolase [Siminovitchia fortis]WHY83653.1 deoxyribose-phosphate aldolase [Siminovitchia fortis]